MGYLDNTGLAYLWGKIKAKLVQPDWNQNDATAADYVKNRPGGYDKYNINITWDGVIGNRLTVLVSDTTRLVKVSNLSMGTGDINNSLLTISNGKSVKISDVTSVTSTNVVIEGVIAFVSTPGWVNEGVTFPESGVYFGYMVEGTQPVFITKLESNLSLVRIPLKYLNLDDIDGVLFAPQDLTEEQKQQARENIGAGTSSFDGDYNSLSNKPTTTTTEATLLASGWMGDSAPYTYTLSVTGVTADSNQEFLPALDITAEQLTALQAANIQDGGQAEDTVTLKAFGTKPTIDLPIRVLH